MSRPVSSRRLNFSLLLVQVAFLTGCTSWPVHQQHSARARYEFALIGDAPYTPFQATNAFPKLLHDLNRTRLAFVVHDGDIKGGSVPCSDEILEDRLRLFQTSRHPFVLVFGDNEWTDCGDRYKQRPPGDAREPQERLDKLRRLFWATNETLGQRKLKVERQSDSGKFNQFSENIRWFYGGVLFVGLNIVGSGNNAADPNEFIPRQRANLAWVADSFALANRSEAHAIMLIIQANPKFEEKPDAPARAGFNDFLALLHDETIAFRKPVVLVHGDSHYFRIDKPMLGMRSGRRVENFTRVETFGNPDVHWVQVSVDWRDPNVFTFRPRTVEGNLVPH